MAAPVAHFDEDWPSLAELNAASEAALLPGKGRDVAGGGGGGGGRGAGGGEEDQEDPLEQRDGSLSPGGPGAGFRSMEDLVNGFDETLSMCFRDYNVRTENIAPVSAITEDTLLDTDEIWNALTSNYGQVMAVDWKQSRTCSLHMPAVNLEEQPRKPGEAAAAAEVSDDEELREQLDMHSIIVSCLADEPLFTAEQVIEEIEEMMQDSPELEAEHHPSQSDLSMVSLDIRRTSCGPGLDEERVRSLSEAELNERLEETEANIRRFSEELVQQLARRDELDFEKEVKNCFISALIDVQNRQKEHRESLKKKKKLKGGAGTSQGPAEKTLGSRFSMEGLSSVIQNSFRQTFGSGCSERQYLTTVIPYEKKGHPPSLEDLQILTKILHAMRDDSDKVPGLLTDYILKVLCPT